MQWQIPVHVIAPEAPRRLPWDARSPLGSGSPNAAADPVRFEAKADALQLAHRVLEAALADEAPHHSRVGAGRREAQAVPAHAAAGPDGELRAYHGCLGGAGGGAAQEAPPGLPAADGARDAPRRVSVLPLF